MTNTAYTYKELKEMTTEELTDLLMESYQGAEDLMVGDTLETRDKKEVEIWAPVKEAFIEAMGEEAYEKASDEEKADFYQMHDDEIDRKAIISYIEENREDIFADEGEELDLDSPEMEEAIRDCFEHHGWQGREWYLYFDGEYGVRDQGSFGNSEDEIVFIKNLDYSPDFEIWEVDENGETIFEDRCPVLDEDAYDYFRDYLRDEIYDSYEKWEGGLR